MTQPVIASALPAAQARCQTVPDGACLVGCLSAKLSMLVTVSHRQSFGVWIDVRTDAFRLESLRTAWVMPNMEIYRPKTSLLQHDRR